MAPPRAGAWTCSAKSRLEPRKTARSTDASRRSLMPNESIERSSVRVAVAGVGYWGKNLVRNFHDLGALEVLCDAQGSVEATCRDQYPGVRFCRDFGDVLADPSVTAVAIATPAVTHFEMAKAALEGGKDVFVEKPLAIDVRHGEQLVALAAARG